MRTILITGASRGIGLATAKRFLEEDWFVVGTSTSETRTINHKNYMHVKVDFNRVTDIEQALQKLKQMTFDCIISNAGILLENSQDSAIDNGQLITTLQVNLLGPIQLIEGLFQHLKAEGTIITVTSNWGSFSDPNFNPQQPHYKISKAALNMYTKLLAARRSDLTVVAFDPGWVKTDMGGHQAAKNPEEVAEELCDLSMAPIESGAFYRGMQKRGW